MADPHRFLPYRPPLVSDEETLRRAREFTDRMRGRRSVRQFSRRPVTRPVIEQLVAGAGTAPSGANLQPWRFVAIEDAAVKREIRLGAEEEERRFYSERATRQWLEDLSPLGTGPDKPFLEDAPWIIVVFAIRHGTTPSGDTRKHYYVSESVGIATGFLIAAIHEAGLCTLTHTPSPMGFLNDILGRPDNERAFLLLPVGYPAEDAEVPDIHRKPLTDILEIL